MKGWLGPNPIDNYLLDDEFFKLLFRHDVSFYQIDAAGFEVEGKYESEGIFSTASEPFGLSHGLLGDTSGDPFPF